MARSILIIEDDAEFAQFVITGFEEEGFRVEHAVDGKQGRAMLHGRPWDLVLLDWSLPQQDEQARGIIRTIPPVATQVRRIVHSQATRAPVMRIVLSEGTSVLASE
jgi:CheY-like chemotaxis protein